MDSVTITCPWCKEADLTLFPEFIWSQLNEILSECPKCGYCWITLPKAAMTSRDFKRWKIK